MAPTSSRLRQIKVPIWLLQFRAVVIKDLHLLRVSFLSFLIQGSIPILMVLLMALLNRVLSKNQGPLVQHFHHNSKPMSDEIAANLDLSTILLTQADGVDIGYLHDHFGNATGLLATLDGPEGNVKRRIRWSDPHLHTWPQTQVVDTQTDVDDMLMEALKALVSETKKHAKDPDWDARQHIPTSSLHIDDFKKTIDSPALQFTVQVPDTLWIAEDTLMLVQDHMDLLTTAMVRYMYDNAQDFVVTGSSQSLPYVSTAHSVLLIEQLGVYVYPLAFILLIPYFVHSLSSEKANGMRDYAKMSGLRESAFIAATVTHHALVNALVVAIVVVLGFVAHIPYFRSNSPLLMFFVLSLLGIAQSTTAFIVSTLVRSPRVAPVVTFILVILIFIANAVLFTYHAPWYVYALTPIFPIFYVMTAFSNQVMIGNPGATISSMLFEANGAGCTGMLVLSLIWGAAFVLGALWVDSVWDSKWTLLLRPFKMTISTIWAWCRIAYSKVKNLSNKTTTRSPEFDAFSPTAPTSTQPLLKSTLSYDTMSTDSRSDMFDTPTSSYPDIDLAMPGSGVPYDIDETADRITDPDVLEEKHRAQGKLDEPEPLVRVIGLHKTFRGDTRSAPAHHAVRGLYLTVRQGECFGLLGHNGAGKTTTINMLCGLLPPTSGSAVVDGKDILNAAARAHLHSILGVTPQFDVYYHDLSCMAHILYFARIKGVSPLEERSHAKARLLDVGLDHATGARAKHLSGGMRRRLSLAQSLCGDPKVLYLDEPTTGLDPATRQSIWAVLRKIKKSRAVLMTTHSMAEAEAICDRLGIMATGKLRAVGTRNRLKTRFGGGLRVTLETNYGRDPRAVAAGVAQFMADLDATISSIVGSVATLHVPPDHRTSKVLRAMMTLPPESGVADWSVTTTSLEHVYNTVMDKYNDE
ncbi:ABC transporter subfamily A-like [Carpediemonas membranifera]|uniref:ABC transporter subfamily A-like n=1 Tax=Carpediemonas membranifera TaxID=201153 RepID=A0A8J6B6A0_9EUKA|nr:ABC transporter subfamily A-like [Carpediemonas membranifera]|eukprot:KAG9393959.1 ABC transporter subfamily A-like [Carpediemonas membranifera]